MTWNLVQNLFERDISHNKWLANKPAQWGDSELSTSVKSIQNFYIEILIKGDFIYGFILK